MSIFIRMDLFDFSIDVEGYIDDSVIFNNRFLFNWELLVVRVINVVCFLV